MSFIKITDPAKRDFLVKKFIESKNNIQRYLMSEQEKPIKQSFYYKSFICKVNLGQGQIWAQGQIWGQGQIWSQGQGSDVYDMLPTIISNSLGVGQNNHNHFGHDTTAATYRLQKRSSFAINRALDS